MARSKKQQYAEEEELETPSSLAVEEALKSINAPPNDKSDSVSHTLSDPTNINLKTRIPPEHVGLIARLDLIASKYNLCTLKTLSQELKELSVSIDGKGRGELVDAARAEAITKKAEQANDVLSQLGIPRL